VTAIARLPDGADTADTADVTSVPTFGLFIGGDWVESTSGRPSRAGTPPTPAT
jgi:hypothetical protein